MQQHTRSLPLGFLAGALGGALGSLALNFFQSASLKATQAVEERLGKDRRYTQQQEALLTMFEKAHLQTAEAVAGSVGVELTSQQRKAAPPVTEFAFGILCAGGYGVLAEYFPEISVGAGTVYGAALFAGASLVVLPAMGYVPSPQQRTPIQHFGGLAGNVVYGAVTEGVRSVFR